ncbi:MAG: nitroreductase family protein [Oscillospiraceae bacterium]|nr:nitroreductase family protein [Oscillospiraceae bacterium]
MDAIEAVLTRKSIRKYTGENISEENLRTILEAAVSGPTCANTRDWQFIVVRDRETLNKMADANGRPAEPLRNADVGILVLGDLDRAFSPAKDYWIIDGAIAGQNICIAAHGLGLGAVWLGTYPQAERVDNLKRLFDLPDNVIPHSIIALGVPAESGREKPPFEEDRFHFEKY